MWFGRGRIQVKEIFVALTRLFGLFACGLLGMAGCLLRLIWQVIDIKGIPADFAPASMSASGIQSSCSFSGRKTSRGLALRSFASNIRRSTRVAPGFRYAGQCVLLMVTTRSYMASPPDAVAGFPSAKAVIGAVGQIEVHGVASRIIVEVVKDQARAFQHSLNPGL